MNDDHDNKNFIYTNHDNQHVKHSLIFSSYTKKKVQEVSENTAKRQQGKKTRIANYRLSSLLRDNSNHSSTTCTDGSKKSQPSVVIARVLNKNAV